jgi:hypothetical protein
VGWPVPASANVASAGTRHGPRESKWLSLKCLSLYRSLDVTFAHGVGMHPRTLDEIEVRGLGIDQAKRPLVRPNVLPGRASVSFGA